MKKSSKNQRRKIRNPVARYARRFNRAVTMRDKTKYSRRNKNYNNTNEEE